MTDTITLSPLLKKNKNYFNLDIIVHSTNINGECCFSMEFRQSLFHESIALHQEKHHHHTTGRQCFHPFL